MIANNWVETEPGKYNIEVENIKLELTEGNNGWLIEVYYRDIPIVTHYYSTYDELHKNIRDFLWKTGDMFATAAMTLEGDLNLI